MQVNKPDRGIFKGMGSLQKEIHTHKKNFPTFRNKNQFDFTHKHENFYQSTFNYFHKSKFLTQSATNRFKYQKVKKNSNTSQVILGTEPNQFKTFNQTNYKKYENYKALKPIYQKEQGIQLGNEPPQSLFKTSNQQVFGAGRSISTKQNIYYTDWRGKSKYNPITGQIKSVNNTFGYQDYKYNGDNQRKYKANNFTRIPKLKEKYDIITGRKLEYA